MLSDPITWLDVLVLIAAYLLASLAWRAVERLQRARGTFDEITETAAEVAPDCADPACPFRRLHHAHIEIRQQTGGEAAPERQEGGSAATSRAGCPAASPPHVHRSGGPFYPECPVCNPEAYQLYRLDREHVVRRRD